MCKTNPYFKTPSKDEMGAYKELAVQILNVFVDGRIDVQSAMRALEIAVATALELMCNGSDVDPMSFVDSFGINVRTHLLSYQSNRDIE